MDCILSVEVTGRFIDYHMIFDTWQQYDLSPDWLLSLKNQRWLGPRQRVSGADLSSFQSEMHSTRSEKTERQQEDQRQAQQSNLDFSDKAAVQRNNDNRRVFPERLSCEDLKL
ncbi:hypothetical protein TNCV_634081 [Trichonephila clavipes]|nr:hypothetical protein TNCV_634081 [Trichonephila clavipes]